MGRVIRRKRDGEQDGIHFILGLCRIPYERARMTDQEPRPSALLRVEDHTIPKRNHVKFHKISISRGKQLSVHNHVSSLSTLLVIILFSFLPILQQPEPFRENAPQRCPLCGASHLHLAGLTSTPIHKVLSFDTPIQRTASTLSAGFPKVAERVRTLGAWLYVPSC